MKINILCVLCSYVFKKIYVSYVPMCSKIQAKLKKIRNSNDCFLQTCNAYEVDAELPKKQPSYLKKGTIFAIKHKNN
jgi:hypothetical protein